MVDSCRPGYHIETKTNSCDPDLIACDIQNGTGQQQWNGSVYSACMVLTCNENFEIKDNSCIATVVDPPTTIPNEINFSFKRNDKLTLNFELPIPFTVNETIQLEIIDIDSKEPNKIKSLSSGIIQIGNILNLDLKSGSSKAQLNITSLPTYLEHKSIITLRASAGSNKFHKIIRFSIEPKSTDIKRAQLCGNSTVNPFIIDHDGKMSRLSTNKNIELIGSSFLDESLIPSSSIIENLSENSHAFSFIEKTINEDRFIYLVNDFNSNRNGYIDLEDVKTKAQIPAGVKLEKIYSSYYSSIGLTDDNKVLFSHKGFFDGKYESRTKVVPLDRSINIKKIAMMRHFIFGGVDQLDTSLIGNETRPLIASRVFILSSSGQIFYSTPNFEDSALILKELPNTPDQILDIEASQFGLTIAYKDKIITDIYKDAPDIYRREYSLSGIQNINNIKIDPCLLSNSRVLLTKDNGEITSLSFTHDYVERDRINELNERPMSLLNIRNSLSKGYYFSETYLNTQ